MTDTDFTGTVLSKREQNWILGQRITRTTDQQEVLIYPMGAERYLSSVLNNEHPQRYPLHKDIHNKNILIIPGYGISCFIFAKAGARSITVYDKDPVTIAWMKAYKKYYHYREYDTQNKPYPSVGELLTALTCWYPPLLRLPKGRISHTVLWLLNPNALRRQYLFYIMSLLRYALSNKDTKAYELEHSIHFHTGELKHLINHKNKPLFDTAFVPYLLGVRNGIEKTDEISAFINQIMQLVPNGHVLVTPTQKSKEFYVMGQTYFTTTDHPSLASIPDLTDRVINEDKEWFKTQGLTVFSLRAPHFKTG
ncbi:hypothetical protein [Legionella worsleiensis]|uniref:ABC transporter permease n=1 Tax=Legionella worsleiensis TaxID=45076 RepID=A0A0W1A475_9GAMM|nr:hypothetical protein [Legionella worsleiensis]KTD76116.1 ABC transporter permease [Legionella worsleiensis]STY33306.1 ABC transporter permease [Legionella worsleiensis]